MNDALPLLQLALFLVSNTTHLQNLGQAPVHHLHFAKRTDHDVGRLKVAMDDAFLEDLGSTNGTYVNGRLVKKQALSDGDEIIIGKYKLVFYSAEASKQASEASLLESNTDIPSEAGEAEVGENQNSAIIEVKNGAKAGQILPIQKPVTTLGRPGIQIAAIMKKPEGYFFMHIESEDDNNRPRHNQSEIGEEPVMLKSGDNLTVAGINVEFMLS